jgi:hypothetical protein
MRIEEVAKEVKIDHIFKYIDEINSEKTLIIKSRYPTIDSISCTIKKSGRYFNYISSEILPKGPPALFQSESYGFQKDFSLIGNNNIYKIKNGAGLIKISFSKGFISVGRLYNIESNFDYYECYYKAIYSLSKFDSKPLSYIQSEPYKTSSFLKAAGYIKLKIDKYEIIFYDYPYKEKNFIVVETLNKVPYNKFKIILNSILFSYALLSGNLFRNENYIFCSKNYNFISYGFKYKRLKKSYRGISTTYPELLFEYLNLKKAKLPYFPLNYFENLVQNCYSDKRIFRAIKIIVESSKYPLEIQASTYSVALETLKNVVLETNEQKVNPFKNKKIASTVIRKLKDHLDSIDESYFQNKKSVYKRIEQINQVGNKEGFQKMFELLNIKLNKDDIYCIDNRNDFLHGRIPFDSEKEEDNHELRKIVLKLHLLLTMVILKLSDYNGYVLNNIKLFDLKFTKQGIREDLFRYI